MFTSRPDRQTLVLGAPAKINLYLQVLRKRDDGFHDINSLFQAVSLFDRLTVRRSESEGLQLRRVDTSSVETDLPLDESNIITRAYNLMADRHKRVSGLAIALEKNIPVAAGLAGGSSDAAATIAACNELFELGLTRSDMATLGLEIGSDIPFFFSRGQAIVTGRGENVREIDCATDYWLMLVTPRLSVSTAEAYRRLRMGLTNPKQAFSLGSHRPVEKLVKSLALAGNDFEEIQFMSYPELSGIRDRLLDTGALLARMSGSGPTVFGVYPEQPAGLESALLREGDWHVSTVRPITLPIAEDI